MKHTTIARYVLSLVLMTIAPFFLIQGLSAQVENAGQYLEDQRPVQILTNSGTTYEGILIVVLPERVTIELFDGAQVAIEKDNIKSLAILDEDNETIEGDYSYENPMPNRNFITETAFAIEKGKGFYQNVMVLVNNFGYGITDNFSVSGGFESVSLFLGEVPVFFIQPKYTFTDRNSSVQMAVGSNLISIPNGGGRDVAGTLYGATTFGNINQNFTIGVAFPFGPDEFSEIPVFQLGGQYRLSESIGLVTDNLIVTFDNDTEAAYSLLLRIMKENWSLDIGFASVTGANGAAPLLGVNIKLGQ